MSVCLSVGFVPVSKLRMKGFINLKIDGKVARVSCITSLEVTVTHKNELLNENPTNAIWQ